jgi:hypothetical protein
MSSKPYDIVLLPEASLATKVQSLSIDLAAYTTHFTIDESAYFSHLSLYMLQLKAGDINQVCICLETLANTVRTLSLEAKAYHYENNYLDVEYHTTTDIVALQKQVIELANPLRDGLRTRDVERLKTAVGEERDNILTYGYRSVGESFHPHTTFTRFIYDEASVIETLPPVSEFGGEYSALGLFKMGDNGTCIKPIQTWPLR